MKDIINRFAERIDDVTLVYGNMSNNGESLDNKVKLVRIVKYRRKSTFSRLVSWLIATLQLILLVNLRYRKHYLFFTTNPPTTAFLTLFCKNRYSVNVLDIYPEALSLGGFVKESSVIYKLWEKRNFKFFNLAQRIFILTDGMKKTISKYCDSSKIEVIPYWSLNTNINGIERNRNKFLSKYKITNKFIVLYSGNLGLGHHVTSLVKVANHLREDEDIVFVIMGDGWNKPVIEKLIEDYKLENCLLLPYQPSELFIHAINGADIGVVSVSKELAPVCVPSKTYNLINNKVPLLFITEGESELQSLANRYNIGKCFPPDAIKRMGEYVTELKSDHNKYSEYKKNLAICAPNFSQQNALSYVKSLLDNP